MVRSKVPKSQISQPDIPTSDKPGSGSVAHPIGSLCSRNAFIDRQSLSLLKSSEEKSTVTGQEENIYSKIRNPTKVKGRESFALFFESTDVCYFCTSTRQRAHFGCHQQLRWKCPVVPSFRCSRSKNPLHGIQRKWFPSFPDEEMMLPPAVAGEHHSFERHPYSAV